MAKLVATPDHTPDVATIVFRYKEYTLHYTTYLHKASIAGATLSVDTLGSC